MDRKATFFLLYLIFFTLLYRIFLKNFYISFYFPYELLPFPIKFPRYCLTIFGKQSKKSSFEYKIPWLFRIVISLEKCLVRYSKNLNRKKTIALMTNWFHVKWRHFFHWTLSWESDPCSKNYFCKLFVMSWSAVFEEEIYWSEAGHEFEC